MFEKRLAASKAALAAVLLFLEMGASGQAGPARLINISSRASVGTGPGIEIAGFVIEGTGSEQVLVRAVGPTLAAFGVTGVLENPVLSVFDAQGRLIASNAGWGTNSNPSQIASVSASVGAFALPTGSADSALLLTLPPGAYSAQASGAGATTGNALIEVYEVAANGTRAVNISTRAYVGSGPGILIAGFAITGTGAEQILIRGVGPALASYGVAGTLAQPQINLFNSQGAIIGSNSGWGTSGYADGTQAVAAAVGAFALPNGSADCALLANLPAGNYTVQVSGVGGATGNGLVELYELPASSFAPAWSLSTADTQLNLTIVGNRPAITRLEDTDPQVSWNWAPSGIVLPLLASVSVGGTSYAPSWTYQGATVDTSNGTQVTLNFASTPTVDGLPGGGLALTQVWLARPGPGPVEESTIVTNNTGSDAIYNDSDVLAADLTAYSDQNTTLWTFARQSVRDDANPVPGFDVGVFKTVLTASASVASVVSNDYNPGQFTLPFAMLDVNAAHGLYLGYVWDFGQFSQTTYGNAHAIRNRFSLWSSGTITEPPGAALTIPGMFFGTYVGDTDDGSNRMKEWFWSDKITPTLRANANEPLVEINIPATSESGCEAWLAQNAIASWGVDLIKEDAGWNDDVNSDPFFGWDWNPNSTEWPNGMTLGTIADQNGVKLSLYMGNRYDHANLATAAGVSSEQQALLTRYDNWHYDYWRSDMELEPSYDYLSHQGFVAVLDYMIANRPGFRWENCSAGGSKKSFDLLQRQTFMTTEDTGSSDQYGELNYLKAYYANVYMICPVQMKTDNVNAPNYPPNMVDTIPWERYQFRSGFLGGWMYGGAGAEYPAHIALYKTYQRPILRGADVYHLAGFPMPDGNHWDGFEFFNTALNKGSVILLKPNSGVGSSPAIFLRGLNPAATYTLTFQDRTDLNSTYAGVAGSSLMAGGAGIAPISGNSGDYDSEIIWINQ